MFTYWTEPLNFRARRWSYHLLKVLAPIGLVFLVAILAPALLVPVTIPAALMLAGVLLWGVTKLIGMRDVPLHSWRDLVADLALFLTPWAAATDWLLLSAAIALYLFFCTARWFDEQSALVPVMQVEMKDGTAVDDAVIAAAVRRNAARARQRLGESRQRL